MSPEFLRRTDEVVPPPPSRPRLVALGELLTTRRHLVVPEFPAPPPMPRGLDGTIYSRRPQQLRRALSRLAERKPVLVTTLASVTGFALAMGVGLALGFRRKPRTLIDSLSWAATRAASFIPS